MVAPQPHQLMTACLELLYLIHGPVLLNAWCVMSGWNMYMETGWQPWHRIGISAYGIKNMNSMFVIGKLQNKIWKLFELLFDHIFTEMKVV